MIELSSEKFSLITSFFPKAIPNYPVVMAVIEGNNPGKVWVDKLVDPLIALVITNGGYSFIGRKGRIDESIILEAIELLKANKPIKLIWEINNPSFDLFEKAGFIPVDRIQFYHPSVNKNDIANIDVICKTVPSDCEIKLIDASLLEKSHWLTFIKQIYGNEDNFLKHGYGLALLRGQELISEAFACYIGGDCVETGSITSENHRGQGYATLIRAFLIKESFARNLKSVTSCNAENIGSAKVSKKLGFKIEKKYWFLEFR